MLDIDKKWYYEGGKSVTEDEDCLKKRPAGPIRLVNMLELSNPARYLPANINASPVFAI